MKKYKIECEKKHNRVRSQLAGDKGDPQSWSCQGQSSVINANQQNQCEEGES